MRTKSAKRMLGGTSSLLALSIALPQAIQAQSADTSNPEALDEIVVTGLIGSLQRNLDLKREATGVVDVITSEDIGKFPDSNVAASLQRVPGVSIQRAGTRGEPEGITVRGFGGDFNETLYDGRRISTAAGGRSVDFSTVGADFVGSLTVMKTPDVTLSSSSIGATVNIAFPKPFDSPGTRFVASAAASEQEEAGSIQPSGGLLFSTTFADDTMGFLADAIYTKRDTDTNRVFVSGWEGGKFAPCQLTRDLQRRRPRRRGQDHRRLVAAAIRRRTVAGVGRAHRRTHRVPVAPLGQHAADHRRQLLAPEDRDQYLRLRPVVRPQRPAQRARSTRTAR